MNRFIRKNESQKGFSARALAMMLAAVVAVAAIAFGLSTLMSEEEPEADVLDGVPKMVIEQDFFDYGAVVMDTPIETVFIVKNEGDAPLKIVGEPIVEVRDGC